MKKTLTTLALALVTTTATFAQVGIGTKTPDASAALDLTATDKGFLPPRLTTTERDLITSPAEGLVIYNTTVNCLQWYNGTAWFDACEGGLTPGPVSDCSTPGFIPPFLTAAETIVEPVTNPVTGDTWMDRNLGAYTPDRTFPSAAGGTDCWAYGNLYQWGRNSDGHESRLLDCVAGDCFDAGGVNTSLPATAADVTDPTWAGKFIYNVASPFDWHDDNPDNTLWTSTGGTNNPCPAGYRVPTEAEWVAEWDSWDGAINGDGVAPYGDDQPTTNNNREGAINSPLKLPVAGLRDIGTSGLLRLAGSYGYYWSSTVTATVARNFNFDSSNAFIERDNRAYAGSVRCLKD